jgi:hypothetical protein
VYHRRSKSNLGGISCQGLAAYILDRISFVDMITSVCLSKVFSKAEVFLTDAALHTCNHQVQTWIYLNSERVRTDPDLEREVSELPRLPLAVNGDRNLKWDRLSLFLQPSLLVTNLNFLSTVVRCLGCFITSTHGIVIFLHQPTWLQRSGHFTHGSDTTWRWIHAMAEQAAFPSERKWYNKEFWRF